MSVASPVGAGCANCGTQLAPQLLACPGCGRLAHAAALQALAARAQEAERERRFPEALQAWRDALELLPARAPQREAIGQRMLALSREQDAAGSGPAAWWRGLKRLGPWGALVALFSKLKFLLLGLSKLGTVLTMLASLWIYAQFWGWRFALGFVVLIYIHEMGHVQQLHRYGIRASAPVFIPGFGALIRMRQYPSEPRENARAGLAGPLWGTLAALACAAVAFLTHNALFTALAEAGGFLNLFNLLPVWQLDGARGFHALTRWQRWSVAFAFAAAWIATRQGLLILLALVAAFRATQRDAPPSGDTFSFVEFLALIAVLAPLAALRAFTA